MNVPRNYMARALWLYTAVPPITNTISHNFVRTQISQNGKVRILQEVDFAILVKTKIQNRVEILVKFSKIARI